MRSAGSPRYELLALEGLERCLGNRDHVTIQDATRMVNRGNPAAFNDAVGGFFDAPDTPVKPAGEDEP